MKRTIITIGLFSAMLAAPTAQAWGLLGTMAEMAMHHYEHHRYHGGYHTQHLDCSEFGINTQASEALGPVSMPAGGCHVRYSHGYPIPDPSCTPGAINPTVTLQVLRNRSFRTRCIRNQATSEHQKFAMYRAYGIRHPYHNHGSTQVCELDHLINLSLGGADTLDNIWPECGPSDVALKQRYFKQKDLVEMYLVHMVKTGQMSLSVAQRGIAKDWTQYLDAARQTCGSNPYCD